MTLQKLGVDKEVQGRGYQQQSHLKSRQWLLNGCDQQMRPAGLTMGIKEISEQCVLRSERQDIIEINKRPKHAKVQSNPLSNKRQCLISQTDEAMLLGSSENLLNRLL